MTYEPSSTANIAMAARRGAVWICSGTASDINPEFDRVSIRPHPNVGDVRVHQLPELVNRTTVFFLQANPRTSSRWLRRGRRGPRSHRCDLESRHQTGRDHRRRPAPQRETAGPPCTRPTRRLKLDGRLVELQPAPGPRAG